MMPARTRSRHSRKTAVSVAMAGALTLTACFNEDPTPDVNHPVESSPCVDVPAAVRAQADSLVASGNREMVGNFQYWFDSEDWWQAKGRTPEGALAAYDKALAVAPGHCQALFGRAMASASLITQDKRMDDFIRKMEAADRAGGDDIGLAKKGSFAAVFKTSPDQAPVALAKLNSRLEGVDPPTIQEAQALIELSIMPRLDSTIAALESIMDYKLFAVRFDVDGRTFEIDRGEIGPGLAGLKVAKAWLTVVAGYNLDYTPAEGYGFVRTLNSIHQDDFDHLTPDQTRALDHLTGLFKPGSEFTRQKAAWKARIHAIPSLLLEAVGDAQKGLENTIAEAKAGDPQTYDVWRAGNGEDDDIDTAEVRQAILFLERTKKYLTGEVAVEFARGTRTVKVNLPRLFHVDGVQGMLPLFKFLPYAQWNDTVSADTSWGPWLYSRELKRDMLVKAGYDPALADGSSDGTWHVDLQTLGFGSPGDMSPIRLVFRSWNPLPENGFTQAIDTTMAVFTPGVESPCTMAYSRRLDARIDASGKVVLSEASNSGTASLAACRAGGNGIEFIQWVDAETRGPIEFVDAKGNTTLTIPQMDDIDDPKQLKGKVGFADPTFGGILPGMTNDRFWDDLSALANSPGQRTHRCQDVEGPDGWVEYRCETSIPPNPSDLDYLVYYLYWLDRGF